jgi:hypothetical protein
MSKQSQRRKRAKMIRAAAAESMIHFDSSNVEWIQAADAGEGDKPKRFTMTAYTGSPMRVGYYDCPVILDLAGLSAQAPLPILLDHDPAQIVGHADEVDVGVLSLKLSGVVSGAGPEAAQVIASSKLGFPWKASVGARPDKMEFVADNATTTVNGKTFKGPLYVARKSTLGEVSFVAMAADSKTSAKVAASAAVLTKEINMEFSKWIEALGFNHGNLTDAQKAALQTKYDAEIKAAPSNSNIEGAASPIIEAPKFNLSGCLLVHQKYVANIEAKVASYKGKIEDGKLAEIQAKAAQKAAELKAEALNGEKPVEWLEISLIKAQAEAEVELIRAERPKAPSIHCSTRDLQPSVIEAAMCMAGGLRGVEKQFKPEVLEAASLYQRREGASLQGLILAAAHENGYSGARRIHRGNYDEVMKSAFIRASSPSTHSLTTMLSTVGNKFLLEGFNFVEQVWRNIASIRPVNDFKAITSYRMLDDMVFEEVGPAGEIHHGSISQESFTNQAKTYAKMFALTRQDIINDDLGAFDSIRERIGVGCGKKLNSVFWDTFLDDAVFFNATAVASGGHANLLTTALGESGLAAANVLLKAQKDSNGHPLGLGLQHMLLTGPTLNPTARKWYVSQEIRDTSASTKTPTSNIYFNQFRPVESAYITSTTAWYLLPIGGGAMAPMEVCFLDGVQSPTIESADADFNTLGVQFRGYFDFGVAQKEWRGSVKSTGVA